MSCPLLAIKKKMFIASVILAICNAILVIARLEALMLKLSDMSPIVNAVIGISLIFLCTTLGSSFVLFFKGKSISPKLNRIFLGFAAGIMLSASIFSLIVPALEANVSYMPSFVVVLISVLLGAAFLWGIDKLTPHLHVQRNEEEGIRNVHISKTMKMFMAVTIHNFPEGLSVGIAYGVALAAVFAGSAGADSYGYGRAYARNRYRHPKHP